MENFNKNLYTILPYFVKYSSKQRSFKIWEGINNPFKYVYTINFWCPTWFIAKSVDYIEKTKIISVIYCFDGFYNKYGI